MHELLHVLDWSEQPGIAWDQMARDSLDRKLAVGSKTLEVAQELFACPSLEGVAFDGDGARGIHALIITVNASGRALLPQVYIHAGSDSPMLVCY